MFGSKNKENLEKIETLSKELEKKDEVYAALAECAGMYEANLGDYDSSVTQMEADLRQLSENLDASGAIISENGKRLSGVFEVLRAYSDSNASWQEEYSSFLKNCDQVYNDSVNAVENNKHFTGPSKAISEFSESMRRDLTEQDRELKMMTEFAKQMSVLALNAAIEAGRMGDEGKQFMTAAESIRSYSANYDASVRKMQEQLAATMKKTAELDDDIKRLIALLKDNNVAVSKLMKELSDVTKEGHRLFDEKQNRIFEELLSATVEIHDKEGEVDRMEARNRMQIDDIVSEFTLQKKLIGEITGELNPIMDLTNKNQNG